MHNYDGDIDEVLLTEQQLATRIQEVADEVSADYAGREPLLVGVLKGAAIVMADFSRAMSRPHQAASPSNTARECGSTRAA